MTPGQSDPDRREDTTAEVEPARAGRLGEVLTGDEFSFTEAVGGWRGFIESAAPGVVFVIAYLGWGGWLIPVIASVATVAALVLVRLIQRSSVQQALAGVLGVGIGAIWAWRSGDAGGYFVPGLWANGLYLAALLASMAVRWPAVGIVVGLLKGWGTSWRADARVMRMMQLGTAVVAAMFALRLAVQLPLYLAGAVVALGTAKLAMGVPLFALTLWLVWLLVRNAAPRSTPQDPPPTTR
ncbi:DUF3159 domain-containing protein [Demequina activiva]|uniref:DUF3159 domain-containing protein n=1 Tax=Demequina activiva TaxID=1582364 RepID=A0A919Q4C9_9MICO|nr:DUF3159 domain-containing protein [Demequina activiva]GIG54681.1 hypothetical protein Dac01nite_14330 [Demequina activiva]